MTRECDVTRTADQHSYKTLVVEADFVVVRRNPKCFLFRSSSGSGEHVNVLTCNADTDIRRTKDRGCPWSWQSRDLHLCVARDDTSVNRDLSDLEYIPGGV